MLKITEDVEKALHRKSMHESLEPLVEFCKDDKIFAEFIIEIQKKFSFKKAWRAYVTICNLINNNPSCESNKSFDPTEAQRKFVEFVYSCDRLRSKRVEFSDWEDIASEGIGILVALIASNKILNFEETPTYKGFIAKYWARYEELRKSGKYPELNEIMDD